MSVLLRSVQRIMVSQPVDLDTSLKLRALLNLSMKLALLNFVG